MTHKNTTRSANVLTSDADDHYTIPGTTQRVMRSRTGKHPYQISIFQPSQEPPATGFPVIYLLDANSVFATMVEAVRLQGRRSERTGVVPAIIVGIGYQTDAECAIRRHYDFTLPVAKSELPQRADGLDWPEHGGADAFWNFIEQDLKPEIEREFPIDTNRQAILGHSLGGLFVLHLLFTKPHAFQTYIAGSPSIHWNQQAMGEQERQFVSRIQQEESNLRVLVTIGELEQGHKTRIFDNAKELAERLSALSSPSLHVEFKMFEAEGHLSVLPALINRGLRFASRMTTDEGRN